uniref:C2H2-type domain-containing protein n=1 Tax=Strongyloides venezuelensis TaxID=75913 RepID=A0A0K0EZP6_STRVS
MLRQLLARNTDNVIQENQYFMENAFNNQAGQVPGGNGTGSINNDSGYLIPVQSSSSFITNTDSYPLKDKHSLSSNDSIVGNLNILPNVPEAFIGTTTTGNHNYNYYNNNSTTYNNYSTIPNHNSIALNGGQLSNNENGFYFDGNSGEFCQNYLFGNESSGNNGNNINVGISDGDWNQQYNLSFVPINKDPQIYNGNNNFNNVINQNYFQRNIGINNTLEINGHPKSVDDTNYQNSVTSISSINSITSTSTKQLNKPLRKPSRSIRSSQAAFSEAFKKMALLRHINNRCDNEANYYSIDDTEIGPVRCVACLGEYPSKRSLTGHIGRNEKCREIIGRNYLDQLSQSGNKNILIADYSSDGISPVCPYCDRFISHYKGNIRRHINQCLKNDKKKRCKKSKENKEEYENGTISTSINNNSNNNNSYDSLNTPKSVECQNVTNSNKQTPSFDDPFMCNLCSFLTVYKGNMKRHLMACHNYNDIIFRTGTIDLEQLHASRQGKTISPTLLTRLTKKGKKCIQEGGGNDNRNLPQYPTTSSTFNNNIDNEYQIKNNNNKKRCDEKKSIHLSYNINGITRKLSPGAEARIDTSVQTVIENGLSYYSTI